jgi:hypothetical protein
MTPHHPFTLIDGRKGGLKPATADDRDVRLTEILDIEKVLATAYHPHDTGFPILMYGNGPDPTAPPAANGGVGDCVDAMASNLIQLWRHAAGKPLARLNGATAIQAYSESTGYVVGDESTDQGTDMREHASWWRKVGMPDADGERHKIAAYATFNPTELTEVWAAIQAFGGVGLGIDFPSYADDEFAENKAWNYRAGGSTIGGHAITLPKKRKVYSWAREFAIGDKFITTTATQGFAYISTEFLKAGKTPEGLDVAQLKRILGSLGIELDA